jgi:Ni,Fe-hydrogenase I cytochrome b subunit
MYTPFGWIGMARKHLSASEIFICQSLHWAALVFDPTAYWLIGKTPAQKHVHNPISMVFDAL